MCTVRVDSDDILLVVKALERFKNDEKNLCRPHECEKVYFDKDEADIERYEALLGSTDIRFSMESVVRFKNVAERLSAESLKKYLSQKTLSKALASCGRLLIDYHEENNCSLYMSSALKFYFKAYKSVKKAFFYENVTRNEKTIHFLRLSSKHGLHQDVYIECLKVFCIPSIFHKYDKSFAYYSILEDILKITYAAKVDILNVDSFGEDVSSFVLFYSTLFNDISNISLLIQFGKTDVISLSSFIYWKEVYRILPENVEMVSGFDLITVRSLQIMHLYLTDYHKKSRPFSAECVLKLLWDSITDPYLTRQEFEKSFDPESARDKTLVKDAWTWYQFHVLEDSTLVKSPRSLYHLSRCGVRNQMTKFLQLPSGISKLTLPKLVKNFLLMGECITPTFLCI
ncbi:uncharacterized protein [Parasteatoda tepidariorum]|uniref:uncharacterized protein n=1 Tax=Parasteatoda tepidariorum TaxID=114398 RepID=UPI001C71BE45|nr:uncharacterized protein LOC122270836 [Parasteatoda tepidariorum]